VKGFSIIYHYSIVSQFLCLLLFPHFYGLSALFFIAVVIAGVMRGDLKFKWNKLFLPFFLLFIAYGLGVLFSMSETYELHDLERKLALVIIPLGFMFLPKFEMNMKLIWTYLVSICFLLLLLSLGHSFYLYTLIGSKSAFLSSNFSFIHHPTYFSLFCIFSIEILRSIRKVTNVKYSILFNIILAIGFVVGIALSNSLSGMLAFMIYCLIIGMFLVKKWMGAKGLLLAMVVIPVLVLVLFRITPGLKEQYRTSVLYAREYIQDPFQFVASKQTYIGGNETRLIMWTASFEVLREHPLGVGTGNGKNMLSRKLIDLNQLPLSERHYDPHNQFFQVAIELGWIGLLVFLAFVFTPLIWFIRSRNSLGVLLVSAFIFNCLFESMMERQSGIVFFVLCTLLLFVFSPKSLRN